MLLEVRDQLGHDGIAVGTVVCRVDRVGIIEVGCRVLKLYDDQARVILGNPLLGEAASSCRLAGSCLLCVESQGGREPEMTLVINHRVPDIRMSIVSFGQEYRCTEVHGLSPELAEQLAFKLDAFHP